MTRFTPDQVNTIPVHPASQGFDTHHLAVERYSFQAASQPAISSIAFVWSHGTSFHKEMLHPLMKRFLDALRRLPQYERIDFVFYGWDSRNHGDSARLNDGHVNTPGYTWIDHGMDTQQVVSAMGLKQKHNKVIGVAHSVGGTAMLLAEFMHPGTFDGICVIDPVMNIKPREQSKRGERFPMSAAILKRRDTWESREICLQSLSSRKYWQKFLPEVLENYVNYGLYDAPDGTVKLKCPKEEEALMYDCGTYGSVASLHGLRGMKVPVHVIHASRSTFASEEIIQQVKTSSPLVTNTIVEASHLVPGENPDILVPEIILLVNRVAVSTNRAKL
ncbi:alpha/beta-hydrolase [Lichtheimia hyalospora FSU 10163]|nr:alpha/beta-hydrolase [Lichtheimia hyalospora FSU 10163]